MIPSALKRAIGLLLFLGFDQVVDFGDAVVATAVRTAIRTRGGFGQQLLRILQTIPLKTVAVLAPAIVELVYAIYVNHE
jgi:hypothetical protein